MTLSDAQLQAWVDSLSDEELQKEHRLLDADEEHEREHPLAAVELWDRPMPRTSQLRAAKLLETSTYLLVTGGNRTGKTELGAILTACALYGSGHPDVVAFCANHGIDPDVFPEAPTRVWCSALTFGDSLEYQRPKLERYLPSSSVWRGRFSQGRCTVTLPNGSVAVFKSQDQGWAKYQGGAIDWLWPDEEHDREVWEEARMRLIDRGGTAVLTMTPLKGLTWVWSQFVEAGGDDRLPMTGHAQLSIHDNPYLTPEAIKLALAGKGAHELAARESGNFTVLEGLVYQMWDRRIHVAKELPEGHDSWGVYAVIDFGTRNPCAILWVLHDPSDDVLWVVDEVYETELSTVQKAERIREMEEKHGKPRIFWADPEDRGARLDLAVTHGIQTYPADKDIREGINAVSERLTPDADGRPHLVILERCRYTIREFEGYVWDSKRSKSDQPEKPLKRNDHAVDAVRYLCLGLRRVLGMLV